MFPVSCIPKGIPSARFVGALDGLTTNLAGVWWIAKRLLSSYNGPLIRVRRSSDSTESDIGYDAAGNLDTAALLAFCGAGDGCIRKVYGQLGTEGDIGQSTAAIQPKIVSSGVLLTDGLYACSHCPDGFGYALDIPALSGSAMSIYMRGRSISDPSSAAAVMQGIGSNVSLEYMPFTDSNVYIAWGSSFRKSCGNPTPSLATSFLATCVSAANNWRLRLNGTAIFNTATNTVGFGAAPKVHTKLSSGGNDWVGMVWYKAEHTSTQWTPLEAAL